MMILAFFAVFLLGLFQCFQQAHLAWVSRNTDGLTVFERRSYLLKAGCSASLGLLALIGLYDATKGVF